LIQESGRLPVVKGKGFYTEEMKGNGGRKLQTLFGRAERLRNVEVSGIRRLFALGQDASDVVSLGIGEPDFSPPQHVLDAAVQAMSEGKTHYTASNGIPELREALAKKYGREYGVHYNPESEILVTVGATEAVAIALLAFVNPGDEVLVPNPGFVCYKPAVRIAGGNPIEVPVHESNGFKPNVEAVTSLVTKKSRVIIINSPNNPTGSVLTQGELSELAKIVIENNLIVVSDEVYEKIMYDNARHYCLASLAGLRDRTIVVNSFSKTFAMTGFRVGCALGPKELITAMLLVQQFLIASVNGPAQYAATAALNGSQEFVSRMVSEFDKRRRLIHRRLNEIEGFRCTLPQGAFYVFPSIHDLQIKSSDLAQFILKEAKVVTTPGSAFGSQGEGYLRMSYATSYELINEALDRIEKKTRRLEK
jgi:aminotransferase